MDWTPGGMSQGVEDRRGSGGGGFGLGGGGLGIVGFIILLVLSLITGRNFLGAFFAGSGGQANVQSTRPMGGPAGSRSPGNDRDAQLVSFVLDDAQRTWTQIFADHGRQYRHAKLVLYDGVTYSGCGTAQAATGAVLLSGGREGLH